MARVTEVEVREIITTSITDLTAFINAANLIVTRQLGNDTTVSAAELKEIERYLTAHIIHCEDPRIQEEEAEGAKAKYQGQTGKNLDATFYGQTVKMLDPTGKIGAFVGKRLASIYAITSPTEFSWDFS